MPVFILDTDVWIHIGHHHPPHVFVGFWEQLDASVANGEIRSPEEVLEELKAGTDGLANILASRGGLFVPLDDGLQTAVTEVIEVCPDLYDTEGERNRADPFVVALARLRGGIVVTRERPRRATNARRKIPDACDALGVPCIDWFPFLTAIDWRL